MTDKETKWKSCGNDTKRKKSKERFQGVSHCPIPTDYECLGLQHKSVFFHLNASVFVSFFFISYHMGMRKEEMNRE